MLQVHKTYTHDGFSDDAKNPDADNYKQIQGLFRVVSLLNKNR